MAKALIWALLIIMVGGVALCILACAAKLILTLIEDIQDSIEYWRSSHE